MAREMRVSPDGDAVAIRTDTPEDANNAWGVMHATHGGAWTNTDQVAGWLPVEGP